MFVAKKSLFDLITEDPENTNSIYLNEKEYISSIIQDIGKLLNTRCILPQSKQRTHLPLNYGLPYMFGMQEPNDMLNPNTHDEWRLTLERTLRYFEPRILRPKVKIIHINPRQQTIDIEIKGSVFINHHLKQIHFPFAIHNPY